MHRVGVGTTLTLINDLAAERSRARGRDESFRGLVAWYGGGLQIYGRVTQ